MPIAAVPEATVNKDDDALAPKDEVRISEYLRVPPPPADTVELQNLD